MAPGFELSANFLEGIGDLWFPIATKWSLGLSVGGLFDQKLMPVIACVIFAAELFLSTLVLARCIGAGFVTGLAAAWLGALFTLPFFVPTLADWRIWGNPHFIAPIAVTSLSLAAFLKVGQGQMAKDLGAIALILLLLGYFIMSNPVLAAPAAPLLAFFGGASIVAADTRKERRRKIIAAAILAVILVPAFAFYEVALMTHVVQQSGANGTRPELHEKSGPSATSRHSAAAKADALASTTRVSAAEGAIQRQVGPAGTRGADDEGPLFTLFVADPHKRRDRKFARQQGRADAIRIRNSGNLSSEDRQLVNAKLRFFEGEAKTAYIQEVKPALVQVTRPQPSAPPKPEQPKNQSSGTPSGSSAGSAASASEGPSAGPTTDLGPVYFAEAPRPLLANVFAKAQAAARPKPITEQDVLHWATEYIWADTNKDGRNMLSLSLLQRKQAGALHRIWDLYRDRVTNIVETGTDGDAQIFQGSPSAMKHFADYLRAAWPKLISDLQHKAEDYLIEEIIAAESSGRLPSGADLVDDPATIWKIEFEPERDDLRAGLDFGSGQKHIGVGREWNGKRVKYGHTGEKRGRPKEYDVYEGYLYFEVIGHEGIYFHLTEWELNNPETYRGSTFVDVAKATQIWNTLMTCLGKFAKGLSTALVAPVQLVIDAAGKLVDMISLYAAFEAKSKFGIDIGYTCISSVCKEFDKCWDDEFSSGSCDTDRMKGELTKGALKEAAYMALPILPLGEQAIECATGSCEDCGGVAAVFVPSLDIARALEREAPVKRKAGAEPTSTEKQGGAAESHAGTSEHETTGGREPGAGEGKAGTAAEKRKAGDHPEPPKEPARTAEETRTEEAVREAARDARSEVQMGGEKHGVAAYGRGKFGGFQLCTHCGLLAEKLGELEKILPEDSDLAHDVQFLKRMAEGYDQSYREGFKEEAMAEQAARNLAAELRKNIVKDPFIDQLLDMSVEDLRRNRAELKKQASASPSLTDTPASRAARADPKAIDKRNAARNARRIKADPTSHAEVERAFGDDLTSKTPGKTSHTTAPRADPLSQDYSLNIDEIQAVGEPSSPGRTISVADRRQRALDLNNREFKDAVTNQKTKGPAPDPRDVRRLAAPRKPISLRDDPNALWTRRFGEISEINTIGERIKESMKGKDTRAPGELKAELNSKLWDEFKNPKTAEGRAVADALERSGYGFVEVDGVSVLRALTANELGARGRHFVKGQGWVK